MTYSTSLVYYSYSGMVIHPSSYENMTDEEFMQSLEGL